MDSGNGHDPAFDRILEELGPFGAAVIGVTFIALFIFTVSIEYTIGNVVATLTMVETPQSTVLLRDDGADTKPTDSLIDDPEIILVREQPITSRIRGTLRHLTARAGWYSRWRGLSLAICTRLLIGVLVGILNNVSRTLMPLWKILATVAAGVLLMGWTHIVMSAPSSKRWTQRLLPLRSWRKIWGPTAVFAIARELVVGIPLVVAVMLFSPEANMHDDVPVEPAVVVAFKTIAIILVSLATWVGIYIPAHVTLIRCQASLLSGTEEPIVPFDRSFGGRIAPEALGSARVGFLDAWRSFDPSSRARLLKFYVKYFMIQVAIMMLFATVFAGELLIFLDKDTRSIAQNPNNIVAQVQNYVQHIGL